MRVYASLGSILTYTKKPYGPSPTNIVGLTGAALGISFMRHWNF